MVTHLTVHFEKPGDNVIVEDLTLIWTNSKRYIITGSGLLGRLLRRITRTGESPGGNPGSAPAMKNTARHRSLFFAALLFVAHALGFVSSVDALMSVRTAPGTVAWIVSLNTFPYVAVPAYWVFGRTKFEGYVIGRKAGESELHRTVRDKLVRLDPYRASLADAGHGFQAFERLAKTSLLAGNRAELLIDGEATFTSMLAGIEEARRYVLVQFYIVRDDRIGRELKQALTAKARSGVAVYFLYDEIGSYRLGKGYIDDLAAAGVRVTHFHSTRGSGNRFQLNFRNHRKVVVVDGYSGWVGGLNVGDEYLGRNPAFGPWRDTHMKIKGPATVALQLAFLEDWHWASGGQVPELEWTPKPADNGMQVLILPSGPADHFETASLMTQEALHAARRRIWIASPYFVPDEGVQAALKLAALRGVEVRILIPERTDNPLTSWAVYAFLGPLLDAGVKVHRYQAGFLHGKTWLIDDTAASVGTVNMDNRSFRLNFEITAWVFDPAFAAQSEAMFAADFRQSREMTPAELAARSWLQRVAARAAYLMAPVL